LKKTFSLIIVIILFSVNIYSQVDTLWTKVVGGSQTEAFGAITLNSFATVCASVDTTDDGHILMTTSTNSTNFYINKSYGDLDILVVKLNLDGDTIWSKNYGGTGSDIPYKIRATKGGGCVIVGKTGSNDFYFAGLQKGGGDGFIMQLNNDGSVLWAKTYGGEEYDMLYDIKETSDGYYVACGETNSNTGDLLGTGDGLAWAIKINASDGKKVWSLAYKGPDHSNPNFLENFSCLGILSDGSGYILAGYTTPEFADLSKIDIFYVKVNTSGKTIWSKECGSDNYDGSAAVIDGGNGTFYIAGVIGGSGNVEQFYGGMHDIWLAKFNADGTLNWEKNYGGSDWEMIFDVKKDISNNLYLAGFSRSKDYDLKYDNAFGGLDYFILKTSSQGDTLFTKRIGGPDSDVALGICLTENNGSSFVLAGRSLAKGGYVNNNFGDKDIWLVKMSDKSVDIKDFVSDDNILVYPNPVSDYLNIDFKHTSANSLITIYNINGICIYSQKYENVKTGRIDISSFPKGIYFMEFTSAKQTFNRKLIKI
jgi:hypothetical protein